MAAVLANWGGYYSQRVYLSEARRLGLAVRPPHVNYARSEFSVAYLDGKAVLFMGLDQVRELTRRTQQRIQRQRPFHLLRRFPGAGRPAPPGGGKPGPGRGVGGAWAASRGCCAAWPRAAGRAGSCRFSRCKTGKIQNFRRRKRPPTKRPCSAPACSTHPLELCRAQIAASGALTTVEAAGRLGQRLRVAGMRQFWRRSGTGRGDYIYFMSLEDLEGLLEVVIGAEVYRRCRQELSGPGPYVIEGLLELDAVRGEPWLRAERIWAIGKP